MRYPSAIAACYFSNENLEKLRKKGEMVVKFDVHEPEVLVKKCPDCNGRLDTSEPDIEERKNKTNIVYFIFCTLCGKQVRKVLSGNKIPVKNSKSRKKRRE